MCQRLAASVKDTLIPSEVIMLIVMGYTYGTAWRVGEAVPYQRNPTSKEISERRNYRRLIY